MFTRLSIILLLVTCLFGDALHAEEMVRIAVGRFTTPLTVKAANLKITLDDLVLETTESIVLSARDNGIFIAGKTYASDRVQIKAKDLSIRDHHYRNVLEIQWRSYRGRPELLVVHPIPIETYVVGIVSSELPRQWPLEALKSQAIAARTFAIWQKYRRLDLPYHMESSVLDQVYHGVQREHPDAKRAVAQTYGQVMTYERRPVNAYFHSTCGGHTESAEEGWGSEVPYLPGGVCGFCEKSSRYNWEASLSFAKVNKALRPLLGENIKSMKVISSTRSGRAKSVRLRGNKKTKVITAVDVRRLLGYGVVWSTLFDRIQKTSKGFRFEGKGAGHGVGMCQWGAKGMAEAGHDFKEILGRYYPGATLTPMY